VIPLAITGLGLASPLGSTRDALYAALARGAPETFAPPTTFDPAHYPGAAVAEVRGFDPAAILGDKGLRNLDRLTRLFLVASHLALIDAGIKRDGQYVTYAGPRAGVCGSTAYGSVEAMTELHRVAVLENPRYLNPGKFPNTVINAALGYVSIWHDLRALNATVCNGNCGALDAVLCAETYLTSERADAILVGGAEAMHEGLYLAFHRMGALARGDEPYAPGLGDSRGMRLGEGAMLAVLERVETARARGARIEATVVGYGTSFEPPGSEAMLVHVHPDSIERAVRAALVDANLAPGDVDVVASCANGVPLYDAAEREALRRVLGEGACVATPKSYFGETLGASGAFGLAAALAWLHGTPVAPVLAGSPPARPRRVLVTAVGFYGNASALVVERAG
jgi:3-oxoacyl-(acyl-carrier-protein) synthase